MEGREKKSCVGKAKMVLQRFYVTCVFPKDLGRILIAIKHPDLGWHGHSHTLSISLRQVFWCSTKSSSKTQEHAFLLLPPHKTIYRRQLCHLHAVYIRTVWFPKPHPHSWSQSYTELPISIFYKNLDPEPFLHPFSRNLSKTFPTLLLPYLSAPSLSTHFMSWTREVTAHKSLCMACTRHGCTFLFWF